MNKVIIASLLLLFPVLSVAQPEKSVMDRPYIEVSGKADMEVTPDEIFLTIRISEEDNKARQTVEELEKEMMKTLLKLDIDLENNLSIVDFSSNFRQHLLKKTAILTSKEYQLKVDSGATTAAVFIALEQLGISNIRIEKVGHSAMDQLQNEVKVLAIKAAREKAKMLAEGIDQGIGMAVLIQELNPGYYPRVQKAGNILMKAYAEDTAEQALPEIEFEKLKLEYSILVRFALTPPSS